MRTAGVSANILFSRTDIPDGELVPVHGETDFKTGKGEAVDPLRVLLVVGPGALCQYAPQSLLPLCGHLRLQGWGDVNRQGFPCRYGGEASQCVGMAVGGGDVRLDI